MKSRAALVILGLVLGVLTVSSAVAETSEDVVKGDEAKKVNVRDGRWSGAGSGYRPKCKYGYCCGRKYHGICHKCCKSAEEAKHMGSETSTPQKAEGEVLDTTYKGGSGSGHGGKCKYGYCCGRGYYGKCEKCCKSAEEAKLLGTEISIAKEGVQQAEGEVLDTNYKGGSGSGHGGKCKYGYCCGRGYYGKCEKCCKSAEEAKLMGTDISIAKEGVQQAEGEVLDTNYKGGSGSGRGKCKYGYCCGRGYYGKCEKCCKSAEEAKLMGTDISIAKEGVQQAKGEVLDTTNKGGSGSGHGGKCKYGYCCGRGYYGKCEKCCKSAEEAKLMGT